MYILPASTLVVSWSDSKWGKRKEKEWIDWWIEFKGCYLYGKDLGIHMVTKF